MPHPPTRNRLLFTISILSLIALSVIYYWDSFPAGSNHLFKRQLPAELKMEGGSDTTPMDTHSEERHPQKARMSSVIETRLVHLDLKGAPPRVSYIKQVLHMASLAGLNGLLLEYEDTFPYKNSLKNLTLSGGAFTPEEIQEVIDYAEKTLNFLVIPLIQTFGHAEFILKGEEFRDLREVDHSPQAFCPSKSGSLRVIEEMVDQVLTYHNHTPFIHIGCDEVQHLHVCPLCLSTSSSPHATFLTHITHVATYVRSKGKIPIIWDDMLRSMTLETLKESGIASLIEPMVWVYAEQVDHFIGQGTWDKYAGLFPVIWAAGAFKGAFGERLMIVPEERHRENVRRWVEVVGRESGRWRGGLGGFVLTGWSRYEHFDVLCELLPAGVPSLVQCGLEVSVPEEGNGISVKNRVFGGGEEGPQEAVTSSTKKSTIMAQKLSQILQCPPTHSLHSTASLCNFPGVPFYRILPRLHSTLQQAHSTLHNINHVRGSFTPYNIRHNYSLPSRVQELTHDLSRLKTQLEVIAKSVHTSLGSIYREEVVLEWIEQNIWEVWRQLEAVEEEGRRLMGVRVWGRRPIVSKEVEGEMRRQLGLD